MQFRSQMEEFRANIIPDVIYKYTGFETGLQIIKNKKLKLSNPAKFNDPFDFYPALVDTSITTDEQLWNYIKRRFQNLSKPEQLSKFKAYKDDTSLMPIIISKIHEDILKEFQTKVPVCCFSKTKINILMWSHYANYHKGFCLGFNFKQVTNEYYLHEVKYKVDIQAVNYFDNQENSMLNWIFTKSIDWEYEQEVRAIYRKSNVDFLSFNSEQLKEVVFGCKMSDYNKNKTIELLKNNSFLKTNVSEMVMSTDKFELIEKINKSN